jgi:hypothetical protein
LQILGKAKRWGVHVSELREDDVVLLGAAAPGGPTMLCSIIPGQRDKMKKHVAISAAGVFYTMDGRRSWRPRNRGTRADFLPDRHPGFGQCLRKLLPAADGKRFCRLEHCGAYRSDSSRDGREIFPRLIR